MSKRLEQALPQKRHTNGHRAHDKVLNVLIHQEMQIKTIREYLLTPTRTAEIETTDRLSVMSTRSHWHSHTQLGEHTMIPPLWKTAQQFLLTPAVCLPYDPAIPLHRNVYMCSPKGTD